MPEAALPMPLTLDLANHKSSQGGYNMVIFSNCESYKTVRILGSSETYQGQQRKTLEIDFDSATITLDKAKSLFTDPDVWGEITVETDGETSIQLNFSLPLELILTTKRKWLNIDSDDELIVLRMAQKSALEIAQEKQAVDISNNEAALIELAGLIAGGNE